MARRAESKGEIGGGAGVSGLKAYRHAIAGVVERYVSQNDFWSIEISIPKSECENWICMRHNPKHFSSSMFLGAWSKDGRHPDSTPIRLLRVMEMPDDSLRIIGRQGLDLFVLIL